MFLKPINTNFGNKYGNNRWIVYSIKINREVYLFSDLEYANWLLVENDPSIKYFCEQPTLIEYKIENGKTLKSIPDMYILYDNGIEALREMKYKKDLNTERGERQSFIQKDWCNKNNYKYEVYTEDLVIENRVYLSNLKILSKLNTENNDYLQNEVKKHLSYKPKTILQLSEEMGLELEFIIEKIFSLIKINYIHSNIKDLFLGPLTEVWINESQIS
ncbi:TnsA endonuclease N-terminal domain-containing protein [Lysinibacillus irui]|uniref:TnsA endonuclease N-terminal domain-containing protein n=1 Tax=Lysinibacillus irui TaxID=2998077 RepID=UPI00388B6E63